MSADAVAWLEDKFNELCAWQVHWDRGVHPRQMFDLIPTGNVDPRDVAYWPIPHPLHDLDSDDDQLGRWWS